MTKKLFSFYWDCGRMGSLDGIFIASQEDVDNLIGKEIYFGEVLGKHSEIYGVLSEKDIAVKSEDPEFIAKFIEVFGTGTVSGFNPLDYYEDVEE